MENNQNITLDNKTIVKLAIAIAYATDLRKNGEAIGPLTNKVLDTVDTLDALDHFASYKPKR